MNGALQGKRVVVTRSARQAEGMCRELASRGAVPIRLPVIEFAPLPAEKLDRVLQELSGFDWIVFTSGNAVHFFLDRLGRQGGELIGRRPPRIAAIGSATGRLLAAQGIRIDLLPDEFTGEQLVLAMGDVSGQRVLLPRARIGRPEIVRLLGERGATVEDIALYDTLTAAPSAQALAEVGNGIEVITFTSPSSVRNFLKILSAQSSTLQSVAKAAIIACIGPSTTEEAHKRGLVVAIQPETYTISCLIEAMVAYFDKEPLI